MEDYIFRHRINHEDMSNAELLEALGIYTCSQKQFFRFLEALVDPLAREMPEQTELVTRLNRHLSHDGYALQEVNRMSGTPIYEVRLIAKSDALTMKVSDKLALIDRVGRALQAKFRFDEIDAFLAEYKIPKPESVPYSSKWVYSKAALQGVDTETLLRIAEELDVDAPRGGMSALGAPRNWMDTKQFRLFISHISKDKHRATRLKECLKPYAINGFVAHEDIQPTLEWQMEIERALNSMDAFIAIHTPGFSNSFWTQQEIGFAVGRGVKIISFKMGEDPTGFISKRQALARGQRTAEEIAVEIDKLLAADDLTAAKLLAAKKAMKPITDDVPF